MSLDNQFLKSFQFLGYIGEVFRLTLYGRQWASHFKNAHAHVTNTNRAFLWLICGFKFFLQTNASKTP